MNINKISFSLLISMLLATPLRADKGAGQKQASPGKLSPYIKCINGLKKCSGRPEIILGEPTDPVLGFIQPLGMASDKDHPKSGVYFCQSNRCFACAVPKMAEETDKMTLFYKVPLTKSKEQEEQALVSCSVTKEDDKEQYQLQVLDPEDETDASQKPKLIDVESQTIYRDDDKKAIRALTSEIEGQLQNMTKQCAGIKDTEALLITKKTPTSPRSTKDVLSSCLHDIDDPKLRSLLDKKSIALGRGSLVPAENPPNTSQTSKPAEPPAPKSNPAK